MILPKKNKLLFALLTTLTAIITVPLLANKFSSSSPIDIQVLEIENYPVILQTYREPNLTNQNTPFGSPLGGRGLENTDITALYLDPVYKIQFEQTHWGLDLIPSKNYYEYSWVYLNTGKRVFFSTHAGTAEYFVDEYGANYLLITNSSETFRTLYVHMQASYIRTGQKVEPGQALGIMGQTGNATGIHLHYGMQVKNTSGKWVYINPKLYIRN